MDSVPPPLSNFVLAVNYGAVSEGGHLFVRVCFRHGMNSWAHNVKEGPDFVFTSSNTGPNLAFYRTVVCAGRHLR